MTERPQIDGFEIQPGLVVALRHGGEWMTVYWLEPPKPKRWWRSAQGWRVHVLRNQFDGSQVPDWFTPQVLQAAGGRENLTKRIDYAPASVREGA